MRVLVFCPVIPDTPQWRTPAFSRSGNQFILDFLVALSSAGVTLGRVESYVPRPAWPRSAAIWSRSADVELTPKVHARLRGYPNLPVIKALWLSFRAAFTIIGSALTGARPDVVYCYNLSVPSAAFLRAATWLVRVPLVFSVNDVNVPGQTVPRTPWTRLDWWLQQRTMPRSDALFVVAEEIARDFAPDVPHLLVAGGLTDDRASALAGAKPDPALVTGDETFRVLLAGSLEPVNGVQEFIEACRTRPAGVEFWVAGTGSLAPLAAAAAAEFPNCRYFGFVDQERLFSLMRTADLLVNLRVRSRLDSTYFFPAKLFEFIASSTLTATTDVGPLVAEFGDVMMPMDSDDAGSLLRAIETARALPARERLARGAAARERMLQRYSWTRIGKTAAAFLATAAESAIGSAPSPASRQTREPTE